MPTKKTAVVELEPEPTITQQMIDEMRSAEKFTVDYLKSQPMRDVYIPRNLFAGSLAVVYNGLRFDYAEGQSHAMPEPIAQIVEIRRSAAEKTAPVK